MKSEIRFNNPWIISIQGLIMLIFGIAAIINPEITIKTITQVFGILLLLSGVFLLILKKSKDLPEFWFYEGIANILIGLFFLIFPAFVANIFVILIGIIALAIGLRNLWVLFNNKPNFKNLSFLRNFILVAFGLLFLFVPFESAVAFVNIVAIAAILYGLVTLYTAYKLFKR